jgi:hypothetical protein
MAEEYPVDLASLREQANRYRKLAEQETSQRLAELFHKLATSYDREADRGTTIAPDWPARR